MENCTQVNGSTKSIVFSLTSGEGNGKSIPFYATNAKASDIEWWMKYNNKMAILKIDFLKGVAQATLNGEYYY